MNRLTPNLFLHSAFTGSASAVETRELDFNLARRSAIIINRIISQLFMTTNTTSGHSVDADLIQEVDLDPDNVDVEFAGSLQPDAVVIDSSRAFRHVHHSDRDTAAGVESTTHSLLQKDFTQDPERQRPISITNIRHHIRNRNTLASFYFGEINMDYFIVELSLEEIGILNASRR